MSAVAQMLLLVFLARNHAHMDQNSCSTQREVNWYVVNLIDSCNSAICSQHDGSHQGLYVQIFDLITKENTLLNHIYIYIVDQSQYFTSIKLRTHGASNQCIISGSLMALMG